MVALVAFATVAVTLVAGQLGLLSGQPPALGVTEGRLMPPSATANSVSSQASLYPTHPQRDYASIAPLPLQGNGQESMKHLASVLQNMKHITLVSQRPDYIYALGTTAVLGFTDDLEFWLDNTQQVIHVRSASRLGQRDFGVNRERVERIRTAYTSAPAPTEKTIKP